VLGCQLGQAGEVAAVVLGSLHEGGHRHQAGHGHRAARDEVAQLGRVDAGLPLLPGHVDLDQHLVGRVLLQLAHGRLRGERVDQAHVRRDLLHLAALELADEVPREQVAVRLLLREQVLGAVLANELDSGLRERGQALGLDVLGGGQHLDLGADPLAHRLEVAPHALSVHRAR
jgi:hypothetical protein